MQMANTSGKEPQAAIEETLGSIQRSLGLLHQLQTSVSNFTVPSQLLVLERLNGLMKEVSTMQAASQDCNLQIPVEVVRFIDDGKNPDEFTKDLLNHCIQRNQGTKGKVDAFKSLRKHMLEELEEAFPEETEAYRALRTASAVESRRVLQAPAIPNGDAKVKAEH